MLQRSPGRTEDQARAAAAPGFALCLGLIAALTFVRIIGLRFSVVDLYVDEAQYWAWSRELAAGYFSKPPLLAWIIAGAERVCGSTEACLRLPAPVFYLGTCALIYWIADALYDRRVAFWSTLVMALAPGLAFSSRVISTDVPLLFFWSLALLAYVKLLRSFDWRWTLVLGLSLGLGALAKYAMIYFVLGMGAAAFADPHARRFLRSPAPLIALAIMAVLLAPNLMWNVEHGFATFQHTGDNIRGTGITFDPLNGFEFIAAQAGMVGPIVFAAFVLLLLRMRQSTPADRLMLAFALPVILLITATAVTTRAHANWAAVGLISATIAATAFLVRREAWRWIGVSVAVGVVAQAALLIGDAFADRITLPGFARGDLYQRTLGWRRLGEETTRLAESIRAGAVAAETRDAVAAITYYGRESSRPVFVWPISASPKNHYELTRRLSADAPEPILFVTHCSTSDRLAAAYASVQPLGALTVASGPTTQRRYFVFSLADRQGPLGPLARCR